MSSFSKGTGWRPGGSVTTHRFYYFWVPGDLPRHSENLFSRTQANSCLSTFVDELLKKAETEKYQKYMFRVVCRSGNCYFGFPENLFIILRITTCNFIKQHMLEQKFLMKFHKTFKKTYFSKCILINASSAFYLFIARLY